MFLFVATSEPMSQVIQAKGTGRQVLSVKEILKKLYWYKASTSIIWTQQTYTFSLNFNVSMTHNKKITEKCFAYQ